MTAPRARLCDRVVTDMGCPQHGWRADLLDLPASRAGHAQALERALVLQQVECGGKAPDQKVEWPLRVVFWNAERLKYLEDSAGFLDGLQADVMLLAEVDLGMARSGQHHTARALSERLGCAFVYGNEFVELGLGDARERGWFKGQSNRCGLHGGAILSRIPLQAPAILRLPETGDWFDGRRGERRVGGRIAVLARARVAGSEVVFASLHLESHGSPETRDREIAQLLPALDEYARGAPIILGGDFNTNTAERDVPDWQDRRSAIARSDPQRLKNPVPHEPLFARLSGAGFDWRAGNAPGTTQRTRPDGTPTPPFAKLDWLFCRGISATNPVIHPALSADGARAISDHDAISADFSP